MLVKFIIDTQLPPTLSRFLIKKGFDAVHTTDFPNGHLMNDLEIRNIAIEQERIIITKDTDFREYFILRGAPPKIFLLITGNCTNDELIKTIASCLPICMQNIEHGNLFILGKENIVAIM